MPVFHSISGPVVFDRCPLKPDKHHVGYSFRWRDDRTHWPRQRWLIWKEPAGWVLAYGDPHVCTVRRSGLVSREDALAWRAELVRRHRRMHYAAGLVYGRAATCTGKEDFLSWFAAEDYARGHALLPVEPYPYTEPYPCVWCRGWHVGRALERDERGFFSGLGVVWLVRDAAAQGMLEEVDDLDKRELLRKLWCVAAQINLRHVPASP